MLVTITLAIIAIATVLTVGALIQSDYWFSFPAAIAWSLIALMMITTTSVSTFNQLDNQTMYDNYWGLDNAENTSTFVDYNYSVQTVETYYHGGAHLAVFFIMLSVLMILDTLYIVTQQAMEMAKHADKKTRQDRKVINN